MTRIATDQDAVTVINVFRVAPENQQAVLDLLAEATAQTMRHLAGYVSANVHRSLDGTKVVNYAQRRSREDFRGHVVEPGGPRHMAPITQLAMAEPQPTRWSSPTPRSDDDPAAAASSRHRVVAGGPVRPPPALGPLRPAGAARTDQEPRAAAGRSVPAVLRPLRA
jgi:quinol monooxygenase YgiN